MRYRRFVQRQGYVVMTLVCAAVIAGSAAWTQRFNRSPKATSPPENAASAADLWQQRLRDAETALPSPTPVAWHAPLAHWTVLQRFDLQALVRTGISGLWRVHDAVDLAAEIGTPVTALKDGLVLSIHENSVTVDHGDGYAAEYAGLDGIPAFQSGDSVRAGESLGTIGESPADERHLPAHLHLRVTRNGEVINPLSLLVDNLP